MPITFISNHDMDRSAGYLIHAMGQTKVAANLSLLMPGSSFIYYGEEIGMLGSRGGNNTDANRRLAMLWGDEDTVKNPIGANYTAKQANGTVKDQLSDPTSLYNHYKKLIAVRKANPEIANGTYTSLSLNEGKVGGFLSQYEGKTVAVIHNTTTTEVTIDLSKYPQIPSTQLAAFVGVGTASLNGTTLTLAGQTSVVLR
jgi:glycosidase